MSNLSSQLMRGAFLRTAVFFVNAITGLFLMPFIVHSLGDTMYGLWVLVGALIGYYDLMDFGLNSALGRYVARAVGRKDHEDANRIVNTSFVLFAVIGGIAFVVSLLVAFFIPALIRNVNDVSAFRTVMLILGVNFAVTFPLRVFPAVLAANIRFDLSTAIELTKIILRTVLIVVLLRRGHGIVALACVTSAMDILGYATRITLVKKLYPYIFIAKGWFDRGKIRPLFSYSVYTFIATVAEQLRFNVNSLIITALLGLNYVTLYSVGSRLITYFQSLVTSAVGMFTPVFSQYESVQRYDLIREKFLIATKISGYLSLLVGGMIIVFGKAFIERWMGREYLSAYTILIVLAVPIILSLMQNPSGQVLYGISKHKFFAVGNIAEGVANVVLSVILAKRFGLLGVALGTAIPMLIMKLFIQPVYTCRVLDLGCGQYFAGTLLPVTLKSLAILAGAGLASAVFIMPDYLVLLVLSAGTLTVFTLVIFFIGFTRPERLNLRNALAGITKGISDV